MVREIEPHPAVEFITDGTTVDGKKGQGAWPRVDETRVIVARRSLPDSAVQFTRIR